jgi:putative membrane protein
MRPLRSLGFLSLGTLVLFGGCATQEPARMSQTATPSGQATAQRGELSDGEVAAVMNALNLGEVQLAQLGRSQASSEAVRTYADMLVSEHTTAMQRQMQLVEKLGVRPVENPLSQQLSQDVETMSDSLRKLSGPEFDRAFMDNQAQLHARALNLVDTRLMPSARDPMLTAELQSARGTLTAHYQEAQARRTALLR